MTTPLRTHRSPRDWRTRRLLILCIIGLAVILAAAAGSNLAHGLRGHGPRPAAPFTPAPSRDWRYIVVHHSATPAGNAAAFDAWHKARGWRELGYHFVIGNGTGSGNGQIEIGPRWMKQEAGAHTLTASGRFNDCGIGICLVGNFEQALPTPAQLASLNRLVAALARRYDIGPECIFGHNEALARDHETRTTLCPGRNLDLPTIRNIAAAELAGRRFAGK